MIVLATSTQDPDLTASDRLYAEALERLGPRVAAATWDGPGKPFEEAQAIVLRATWGYYRALPEFERWLETVKTRLFNPIELVRWNLRKNYVADLAKAGIRVPHSHFAQDVAALADIFKRTGWQRAVLKPIVGASGYDVALVDRDKLPASIGSVVVQEFLPEIAEGEVSLVYFDGVFSHAIRKTPPEGEFRVNSRYGATRSREHPSVRVQEEGAAALRALPQLPLYARVDGVVRDGGLIVIELELIEPALFMEFDPPSAERFAAATDQRLRLTR